MKIEPVENNYDPVSAIFDKIGEDIRQAHADWFALTPEERAQYTKGYKAGLGKGRSEMARENG